MYAFRGAVTFGVLLNVIQSIGQKTKPPGNRFLAFFQKLKRSQGICCISAFQRECQIHHFRDAAELKRASNYLQRCEEAIFYALPADDAVAIRSWLAKWETEPPMTDDVRHELTAHILSKGEFVVPTWWKTSAELLQLVAKNHALWGIANGLGIHETLCLSCEAEIDAQIKRVSRHVANCNHCVLSNSTSNRLLRQYNGVA